jgi:Stage II sporulation protein E (SpoIIE)
MWGEDPEWLGGEAGHASGLEVAHCCRPSGDSGVGGDWYDIIALPGGRTALIVGDAMGHGPEAAAVMVQLAGAARALAALDLPPREVLRRLDKRAAEMASWSFATCVYAVLDPATDSCVIARAGHHPPLLVLSCGTTQVLDGLVESRSGPLDAGMAALRDALGSALARPGATLDGTCSEVADTLGCRDREDDVTLVLARARGRRRPLSRPAGRDNPAP